MALLTSHPTMTYDEITAHNRRDGAKRAAKTRAERKLWDTYAAKFGGIYGEQRRWHLKAMASSLASGVDDPKLVKWKRDYKEAGEAWDRKQAAFQATPITAEYEKEITAKIKQGHLFEGDCFQIAWAMYFKFRDEHAGEVEPLTDDDLLYAGQWTSCGVRKETT